MLRKRKFLSVAIIFLLVTLACGGVDSSPAGTPVPLSIPTATPGSDPAQPDQLETATVAKVVDGDTIELSDGGRVRYIGINTPERDQPYYKEATEANRQLVAGQEIQLELDQDTFDQYGRTLAYVWVEGRMANLEIVSRGYANA